MLLLGLSRSPRFSPNSESRDAAIFCGVADCLRRDGHEVTTVCEDEFLTENADGSPVTTEEEILSRYDAIYNMGRDPQFLRRLETFERRGVKVINSASALLNGSRAALAAHFEAAALPVAPSTPVSLDAPLPTLTAGQRYWLKRGEACAQTSGDVVPVTSEAELRAALEDFRRRGISEALLSPHVEGDLVKFYGVEGTDFFYHYYPTADASSFSKFGLERLNGQPMGYDFSLAALKRTADAAARLSGFIVYGGDCVVRPDGSFLLIDFNDWPSFSRCCKDAAEAIAHRLLTLDKSTSR